jgi:methanogenic corrinoid protein MtbC1
MEQHPEHMVESFLAFNYFETEAAAKRALASMIIACLPLQRATIGMLQARDLKENLNVIVGGAVTSDRWAAEIDADG